MKKIPSLFIAAILLFFTANTVFAKDNPKAASYKTHEILTSSTNASDKSVPVVYFIRDITPEALVKVYQATGYEASGKVGVKVSTGESENSNYLRPAQSLTSKPMKGMLTGPVTIQKWSFVRNDQPLADTCRQIALAIRDEVLDLEKAGIGVIQIDEAAFREGSPIRKAKQPDYYRWAVDSFRITSSGVKNETQIHTHMCYSEFNGIMDHIAAMDADAITIECSRSQMELLDAFVKYDYPNEVGPGVYDIHSARVPSVDEIVNLLHKALRLIPRERLWVNPDCGLKTRQWPETEASLRNMVKARDIVAAEA